MPPNNPVASWDFNFSPVFKLYVALQKSHAIRGDLPVFAVSSLAGNTLAFVNGILHDGQDELKQNVSSFVLINAIAPVGFATLSLNDSRFVSINTTFPSVFGNASVVWLGINCQFRFVGVLDENEEEEDDDDEENPDDPSSFLKDPRPRFMDIVDRRVVTPKVEYPSDDLIITPITVTTKNGRV